MVLDGVEWFWWWVVRGGAGWCGVVLGNAWLCGIILGSAERRMMVQGGVEWCTTVSAIGGDVRS